MKVVFGEPDKMFRLIGDALTPARVDAKFLADFFLTESADPAAMLTAWSRKRGVPDGIEVVHSDDAANVGAFLQDADALVVENQAIGAKELAMAPKLRLIQAFGRDISRIDVAACQQRGIAVRPLDRYSNRLVAEHVIMLMLALARNFNGAQAAVRRPSQLAPSGWAFNWPACKGVRGVAGRVIGLLGLGQIGGLVAEYLRPFGATVIYTRRSRDLAAEQRLGIKYVDMDELLATSDILSIHVPGSAQTRHLLDAAKIGKAKLGMMIVNTARGSIIDEDALLQALRSGAIAAAALDVFSVEPLPLDHPLLSLTNVVLTPHLAAGTRDEAWLDAEIGPVVDAILRCARG